MLTKMKLFTELYAQRCAADSCPRHLEATYTEFRTCQKMTLSDKKGQTSNAKQEKIVTADQSVTEVDIK